MAANGRQVAEVRDETVGAQTNLADFLLIAAQQEPDRVAIETEVACYTYAQLVKMVSSMQVVLRRALDRCDEVVAAKDSSGDSDEPPCFHRRRADEHTVCIALERGPECLVAVHATMLEGCVYNTFDVAEPREKLRTWIEIAQHPVMITSQPIMAKLGLKEPGWQINGTHPRYVLDVNEAIRKGEGRANPLPQPGQRQSDLTRLCYVIFTSGSTGKPKAVMIEHRSACNLVRVWSDFVGVQHDDRLAQMASMAFDNHVPEVYGAMHKRCTSVVVPDMMKRSGPDMVSWLASKRINVMVTVPSHLRSMSGPGTDVSTNALPHLRVLDIGGEALGKDVLDVWAPGRCMFNIYGPTEITVVCAGTRVRPGDEITIGGNLPTYLNHVLDPETLQECPMGVRGVLYTGGIGTARGYLDDEAKTSAKFVEVPGFGRMYCSGDVVSKDDQGRIHYHGRADWQVKVRGIRIELEALEEAVGNVQGVKHCEARVVDNGQKLVLIASGPSVSEGAIKEAAAKLGKGYVLNIVKIVEQSAWKFNTSGKLVRNHVPLEDVAKSEDTSVDSWEAFKQEGTSELELEIARCVAQLISAPEWTRDSHFIEDLGLDSAGFGKLITHLRRKSELQLVDLPMLFDSPTVAKLAAAVEAKRKDEVHDDSDTELLSESEHGDVMLDLLFGGRGMFSDPARAHALCVQAQGGTFTYSQLLRRVVGLQALLKKALRSSGSSPQGEDRKVLLLLEPGAELVVAMVTAVLERHAFCIVDPKTPKASILETVQGLQPCAVLTGSSQVTLSQQDLLDVVKGVCPFVNVGAAQAAAASAVGLRRPRAGSSTFCVTVCESPGGQKLLKWEHSAAAWAVASWRARMDLRPSDRVVQLFNLGLADAAMAQNFDVGLMDSTVAYWASLAAGSCVLIPPLGLSMGTGLRMWLRKERVSVLSGNRFQLLVLGAVGGATSLSSLRLVWATGTKCPGDMAERWAHSRRFAYAYTCPEVVAACVYEVQPESSVGMVGTLPLGRPFDGSQFFVLGNAHDPLPPDTVGSLFVSSPGMASDVLGAGSTNPFVELDDADEGRAINTKRYAKQEITGNITLVSGTEMRSHPPVASAGGGVMSMLPMVSARSGAKSLGNTPVAATPQPDAARTTTGRTARSMVSFRNYLIQNDPKDAKKNPYGEDARPMLCMVVQTAVILGEPLLGAVPMVIMERVLGPYGLYANYYMVFVVLMGAALAQQILQVAVAIALKWLLIGRYKPGEYAIYSTFFLKHWIVDRFSSGSILGSGSAQGGWNFSIGRNFLKVLALKALGTNISLSAMVTTRVVGFDMVSVGHLASVHGPHTLSAVTYMGKRMMVGPVRVGHGATVCHGACVGTGGIVYHGAFVEPLSTVPSFGIARGRWSGVPGRQVGPSRHASLAYSLGANDIESESGDGLSGEANTAISAKRFVLSSCAFAFGTVFLMPFQIASWFLTLWLMRLWVNDEDGSDWHQGEEIDTLPSLFMENLWVFLVASVAQALLQVLMQLLLPVLVCRCLPKIRAPMDVPLYHWRAVLAGFKIFLASAASQEVGDASVQAAYLRLLGARIGKGSSMSEQTLLPDTVSIGEQCFFASGNTLTSVEVDQGRMRVLCNTEVGDGCFLGNENHIAAGIQPNTFVGLRTWVPTMPEEGGSLFGNPAMKFGRPAPAEGAKDGSMCQKVWHHISTSVIDLFFWRILYAATSGAAFIIGRTLFPEYTAGWWPLQFLAEVLIFGGVRVLTWLLVPIGFCSLIYNDRMPLSAPYYSTVITRWFNANKIRRVFRRPFRTSGSALDAPVLRLMGVHVGERYFSPNDDVMIDPPFGRLGDDVTVDYDGQVRQHSFEDDVLKWGPYKVGNGTNIAQAAMVAMSDCSENVTLLRGSVTWKGQVLEAGTYEGAPAAPVDEDLGAGLV